MIHKDTTSCESSPFHEHIGYRIITTFVALCAFLATGWFVPAWCEEPAVKEPPVLEVVDAGERLSVTPWTKDYIRKKPYLIYNGKLNTMTVLWQVYQTPAKSTIVWGNYHELRQRSGHCSRERHPGERTPVLLYHLQPPAGHEVSFPGKQR